MYEDTPSPPPTPKKKNTLKEREFPKQEIVVIIFQGY